MDTEIPAVIVAGTTVKYRATHADYPASGGWALKLYIAGVSVMDPVTGVAAGDSFDLTIPAATTAKLGAGLYQWREQATKGGETFVAGSGTVTVEADIAQAGAGDLRTWEERTLAVVEARLEDRITEDQESYTIRGRNVMHIPIRDLLKLRDQLKAAIEAQRGGDQFGREVRVSFPGMAGEA